MDPVLSAPPEARGRPETMPAVAVRLPIVDDPEPLPPRSERSPGAPRTRADCLGGPRPCPWMGCKYHLAVSVTRAGNLLIEAPLGPDGEPDLDAQEARGGTCALDVIDRAEFATEEGILPHEAIARLLGQTPKAVQQFEARALVNCLTSRALDAMDADAEERAIAARLRAAFAALLEQRRAANAEAVARYGAGEDESPAIIGG